MNESSELEVNFLVSTEFRVILEGKGNPDLVNLFSFALSVDKIYLKDGAIANTKVLNI